MKNGYTLIELLAVIVILGVVATISTPIIGSVINSSKNKSYDQQIVQIENAARTYMSTHSNELPNEGYCKALNIEDIKQAGLLPKDIKDPNTNNQISGYVIITRNTGSKNYTYKYNTSNTCS